MMLTKRHSVVVRNVFLNVVVLHLKVGIQIVNR